MQDKNIIMAEKIAHAVHASGGRAYYVGGFIRDRLLGVDNKDVDIEVHGIEPQTLKTILEGVGECLTMGKSFGIFSLRHFDLDISMPRAEASTGRGRKDFYAFVDPFIGEEKAAMRRDFTINAFMQDILTGEILDFFGGKADLSARVIRHVQDQTFTEDPLRVLRAAQFAARFGFTVADETTQTAATVHLQGLPGERILGEVKKALLKSARPSVFFENLRQMRQLSVWFPELEALIGLPQNPKFHPEGDVWTHSLQVTDEAADLREQSKEPFYFMLAALCHDLGKAVTTNRTDDSVIHAYGHDMAGLPLVRSFLGRMTDEKQLTEYVLGMTRLHMRPNILVGAHARVLAYMKVFDQTAYPEDLLLLSKADHLGRVGAETDRTELAQSYTEYEIRLKEMLAEYRDRMGKPYVMGRDLVKAGVSPGKDMGKILEYIHKLRLANIPKEQQLKHSISFAKNMPHNMEENA